MELPTFESVLEAAGRIGGAAHRTPVWTCQTLSDRAGSQLFLKCENLQRVGAFKFRGALNAVRALSAPERERGVATHSSGNHAAALALAARLEGIAAHVVMPRNTSPPKRAAVEGYGASVTECEPTLEARERGLLSVLSRTGATFIHPYDDPAVIAGQGTAALELLEEVPDLDTLVVPVGGGGLASGSVLAARGLANRLNVYGVEPALADDARRSLAAGRLIPSVNPETIADGLRTSLSERTFAVLRTGLASIDTVSEAAIVETMRLVWERAKLIIEPSAATAVAAVLGGGIPGRRIGIIVSGGNADLDDLPWL